MRRKLTPFELYRYVRVQWDVKNCPIQHEFIQTPEKTRLPRTEFDELVLGEWFHLERLDYDHWWLRVGDRCFNIETRFKSPTRIVEEK